MDNLSDVPCNWRIARLGSSPSVNLSVLQLHKIDYETSRVFIPWNAGDDVILMRDWILEFTRSNEKVTLYARYSWNIFHYETIKQFLGLSFEFKDITDMIYFKLRWQPAI